MLTRLNNGNYVDLSILISTEIIPCKIVDKRVEKGFRAVGITPSMREVRLVDFCDSREDCQRELDHLIASAQNQLVKGKKITKDDVKIFLANLPMTEIVEFKEQIDNRFTDKDLDLWGDLSELMENKKGQINEQ